MLNTLRFYAEQLTIVVVAFTLAILAWTNLFLNLNINANAATLDGISDRIEGKVEQDLGTKRLAVGDMLDNPTEEAKGALTQAKGKAKQDIGTTKNKLDDVGDKLENSSESLLDSVKDIFN